eukprot:4131539-Amphidinium_carterae.1
MFVLHRKLRVPRLSSFTQVLFSRHSSTATDEAYRFVPPILQNIGHLRQGQLFELLAKEEHASRGWTVSDPKNGTDKSGRFLGRNSTPYDYLISADNTNPCAAQVRVEVKSSRMMWSRQRWSLHFQGVKRSEHDL